MLHVGIFPVWLQRAHAQCGHRGSGGYCHSTWDWLIESGSGRDRSRSPGKCAHAECLLIGRVLADVLFVSPIEDLIVVNTVTSTNRSRAFAEWIPGDAKAGTKVTFGSLDYVFPVR